MLGERSVVAILLVPVVVWVVATGGWVFAAAVALILGLAGAEYGRLFGHSGLRPALPLLALGPAALALARHAGGFSAAGGMLALVTMLTMTWHLLDYERGGRTSGGDFAVTLSGIVYLGWIGAYLVSLRDLSHGQWWVLIALPVIWLADSAAFIVGKAIGRHPLAPRLSPKKTWEGYWAGVIVGALAGAGLAHLWRIGAGPASPVGWPWGLALGLLISSLAPLGDLGVSMIKRQHQIKDSGHLIPGHGGALDRLDTWLWAAALAYFALAYGL
jgi:phosphatidate cytidylyltransferase